MDAVWPAVLSALDHRGLAFEDVQLAEDQDREAILHAIFPTAPLYRAYANTMWIRLASIIPQVDASPSPYPQYCGDGMPAVMAPCTPPAQIQVQPQQQNPSLSSLDIWTAFLSSLSCRDLSFRDVQDASPNDRWAMLHEVFPGNALWRAQAASFWEHLSPAHGEARTSGSPPPREAVHAQAVMQQSLHVPL